DALDQPLHSRLPRAAAILPNAGRQSTATHRRLDTAEHTNKAKDKAAAVRRSLPGLFRASIGPKIVPALPDIDHRKSLFARCGAETIVEGDDFERGRPAFRGDERSRQLKRVARTQWVHAKKPCRRFSNSIAGIDLVPFLCQFSHPSVCERDC